MCGLLIVLTTASAALGQVVPGPPRGRSSTAAPPVSVEPVEADPIRCWWRTSVGAVTLGEPFDVRLTCAVLENDNVVVVPDETRLTIGNVPLKPFEIIEPPHHRPTHMRASVSFSSIAIRCACSS
jgi:hypothetical protein